MTDDLLPCTLSPRVSACPDFIPFRMTDTDLLKSKFLKKTEARLRNNTNKLACIHSNFAINKILHCNETMQETLRHSVVGRIPVLQPGGPGSVPDGIRNFNFCPGLDVCPLSVFCLVLSLVMALTL